MYACKADRSSFKICVAQSEQLQSNVPEATPNSDVQRRLADCSAKSVCSIWRHSADSYRPSRSNTPLSRLASRWKQCVSCRDGLTGEVGERSRWLHSSWSVSLGRRPGGIAASRTR